MSNLTIDVLLRLRAALGGAKSVDDLRQRVDDLIAELGQGDAPTQAFNRGLRETEAQAGKTGRSLGGLKAETFSLGSVFQTVASLAILQQFLDVSRQAEALKKTLTDLTGSEQKAAEEIAWLTDTSNRLGVAVNDVSQAYIGLMASSKGTQLEGQKTRDVFEAVVASMNRMNKTGPEIENALRAVSQMIGKTVVQSEELTGQLEEALPGASQAMARALGVSVAELRKMAESGELLSSKVLPAMAAELNKTFGDGGKQAEGFSASWNRLLNQLTVLATGPAGKALIDFLTFATDKLTAAARGVGFLSDTVGALGQLLGGLAAGEFSAAFQDFGQNVTDASVKLMGFKTEAEQTAERQQQMKAELAALTPEIDRFQDAVARGEIKEFPETLQAAIAELRKTGDVAAATEKAMSEFMAAPAKNITVDGIIRLATSIKAVGNEAGGASKQIAETLGKQLDKLSDEQLVTLQRKAQFAMNELGNTDASRKAFAELGQVVESVANVQLQRAAEKSKQVAEAAGEYTDALERLASTQINSLRAEIDLANAKGQTWVAQEKSAELARLEAQWAQTLAVAKQAEIAALQAGLRAQQAALQAQGIKTEQDRQEYAAIVLKLVALGKEAEAQQIVATAKSIAAQQIGAQTGQTREHTTATQADTAAVAANAAQQQQQAKEVDNVGKMYQGLLIMLQGARDRMNELSKSAGAFFEMQLQGILNAQGLNGAFQSSGAAVNAFAKSTRGGSDALDEFEGKAAQAAAAEGRLRQDLLTTVNMMDTYATAIELAEARTRKAFFEQSAEAERMRIRIQAMAEGGRVDLGLLARAAEDVKSGFNLLDEQDLSGLQQAIDGVNERLKQTQAEAQSAADRLAELNAEIAAERGDTAAADKMKLELERRQALTEVEKKLAEARALNERDLIALYEEQKNKLEELYKLKARNLERDQREKQSSASSGQPVTPSRPSSGGASSGGGGAPTNITNNFYVDPSDLMSEDFIRRKIIPTQEKVARLRR